MGFRPRTPRAAPLLLCMLLFQMHCYQSPQQSDWNKTCRFEKGKFLCEFSLMVDKNLIFWLPVQVECDRVQVECGQDSAVWHIVLSVRKALYCISDYPVWVRRFVYHAEWLWVRRLLWIRPIHFVRLWKSFATTISSILQIIWQGKNEKEKTWR